MGARPMKKDLLVAISHHDQPDRLQYLLSVLRTFSEYPLSVDVIVDTQVVGLDVRGDNLTVVSHPSLAHDFHLCWQHRAHFRDRINDYANFFYCENDISVPFENFRNYQENFRLLWPNCVPSFLRVEEFEGVEFALDVTERQECTLIHVGGQRSFTTLKQAYHGCWILPQWALKETMTPDFARLSDSRETAASFPMWELRKTPLLQMEGKQVSRKAFAFHLPGNYARCPTDPHAKIRVADIFL